MTVPPDNGERSFLESLRISVDALLREMITSQEFVPELVKGRQENYYRIPVYLGDEKLEVFIYEDEAGMMVDGTDWKGFEKADFASSDELGNAFINALREALAQLVTRRRDV